MTCRDSSSYAGAGHSIDKRRGWAFRDAYTERCATFLAVQQCARHMLRLERSLIVSEKRRACAGTNVLVGKCQATVVIEVRNKDGELCDFFFPFCFLFPLRDWESWLDRSECCSILCLIRDSKSRGNFKNRYIAWQHSNCFCNEFFEALLEYIIFCYILTWFFHVGKL